MTPLASFYPYILPECMGAPIPLVDSAILRATREFCTHSTAWRVDLDPVPLANSISDYDLDLPTGSQLVVILDVKLDGTPLWPIEGTDGIEVTGSTSQPRYTQQTLDQIHLTPEPAGLATGAALSVRAALKPTLDATSIEDFLFDEYVEDLARGAKAILKRIGGKAWTDINGGEADYAQFKQAYHGARIRAEQGSVRSSLRARPVKFGG